ncbi:MAG: biopolymer transporter ExbD [Cyanobacteria bacterium P01_H01_bin.15]
MAELPSSRKKRALPQATSRPLRLWQDSADQEVRIEIVPLIDVIFCILTFFILAAVGLSRQQAIGLDLPKAASGKPQMQEMLVVSLDNLGQVYVEKQLVTRNQLQQSIRSYQALNPQGIMALYASRDASYNEVVEILDLLRQVGGERVALATLPERATSVGTEDLNRLLPQSGGSISPAELPEPSVNQPVEPSLPSLPGNDIPPPPPPPGG